MANLITPNESEDDGLQAEMSTALGGLDAEERDRLRQFFADDDEIAPYDENERDSFWEHADSADIALRALIGTADNKPPVVPPTATARRPISRPTSHSPELPRPAMISDLTGHNREVALQILASLR